MAHLAGRDSRRKTMKVRSACASKPGHLRAGTGGSSSCCSCEARPSPSGSRPLAAAARSRGAERIRRIQTPGGPEAFTVAILAQGTHWAVAHAQAFLAWVRSPPRARSKPREKRERGGEDMYRPLLHRRSRRHLHRNMFLYAMFGRISLEGTTFFFCPSLDPPPPPLPTRSLRESRSFKACVVSGISPQTPLWADSSFLHFLSKGPPPLCGGCRNP